MAEENGNTEKDISYQPMGRWGPTFRGKGRMELSSPTQIRVRITGPLKVEPAPLWRVVVRKLILSWVWAIQRKLIYMKARNG